MSHKCEPPTYPWWIKWIFNWEEDTVWKCPNCEARWQIEKGKWIKWTH